MFGRKIITAYRLNFFYRLKEVTLSQLHYTMSKRDFSFRVFCTWIDTVNHFYYPRRYYINKENIPADGTPVIVIGNHQNCMMDPMNVELALHDRKTYSLTRGDLFAKKNITSNFLFWLGLLPVNRLTNEGLNGKSNAKDANRAAFTVATKRVVQGNTLLIFPESRHQNKRWLGYFSFGYLHIAFHTAEILDFKKEVYILPFAHHYGDYFHPLNDLVIRFGKPIALSPYYEKYKTKPRTTMREINDLAESQIKDMMLNITDLEHYTAIDALRESPVGTQYARNHGFNPNKLPEKLEADKLLVQELGNEEKRAALDKLQTLEQEIQQNGYNDTIVAKAPNIVNLALLILAGIITLPFFLAAFFVTWPIILGPRTMDHKHINSEGDEMFRSTWNVGFAVVLLPILWILASIIIACFNWKIAVAYFALYPILILVVLHYCKLYRRISKTWKYVFNPTSKQITERWNTIIQELNLSK